MLPLREASDGNWGTTCVYVPFSMSDLSVAEDKLEGFSEDPELFTKEFTLLVRSFDLTWGYLTDFSIPLLHRQGKAGYNTGSQSPYRPIGSPSQQGHAMHWVGNDAVLEANRQCNHQLILLIIDRWDHMINCLIESIETVHLRWGLEPSQNLDWDLSPRSFN